MNKKIIGILVCILFFGASVTPIIAGFDKDVEKTDYIQNEALNMKKGDYNNLIQQAIESGVLSNNDWLEQAKLLASDGAADDFFGGSISIDGDYAIIGAHSDDDNGDESGSAYVFTRSGTSWTQQAKLLASDGAAGDYFGGHVSIDVDSALIGASGDDDGSGSVYVFTRSGTSWTQQAKLLASDGATYDNFGYSVSIDGDTALIGAFGDDDNGDSSGSAYIFTRSGTAWTQQAKLLPSDGAAWDYFGVSVSIDSDYAIIGAHWDDDNGDDSGSAYIFTRSGTTWTQQEKILPSNGGVEYLFGISVSIDGDTVLIGSCRDDDNGDGSGSVYVFTRSGTSWTQQAKLLASDGAAGDNFGHSVSIDGDTALIGASDDEDNGVSSGSAYIFTRSGTAWTQQAKLLPSDGAAWDYFGSHVSIDGDTALIGVWGDDDNGKTSGSAYVFKNNYDPQPFYFVHLTDTHINILGWGANDRLQVTLNHIRDFDPKPAFIIISGDLTVSGEYIEYSKFKDNFYVGLYNLLYLNSDFTVPIYICPGNHDHRTDYSLNKYDSIFNYPNDNSHCYIKYHDNSQIISIDSGADVYNPELYIGDKLLPEGEGLSQSNIDWLTNILNTNKLKIIFMHHPVINLHKYFKLGQIPPNWVEVWDDGCIRWRKDEFLSLCWNNYIGLILSGHTHEYDVYEHSETNPQREITGNFDGDDNGHHYYLTYNGESSYMRTLNVQTPDTASNYAYRKISVDGDEIKVYAYEYAEKTITQKIRWYIGEGLRNGNGSKIARLHVYDSQGNHIGENDSGGLDFDIDGGYYSPLIGINETLYGVEASVNFGEDDYIFEIEGLEEGTIDFDCDYLTGETMGEVYTNYINISLLNSSIGKLYMNESSINHTIYMDDDGDGIVDREIEPTNITTPPPYKPSRPDGPSNGKPGQQYTFTTSTTDPNNDIIFYLWDWGDGTDSGWIGPFNSGEVAEGKHKWTNQGSYEIKVKAKDIYNCESDWSETMPVSMPRNRVVNNPFLNFLQSHPNMFPILQRFLNI